MNKKWEIDKLKNGIRTNSLLLWAIKLNVESTFFAFIRLIDFNVLSTRLGLFYF